MWTILTFLTGLGGTLTSLVRNIRNMKLAQLTADTIVAKAQINRDIQEAEARKSIIIAEAGSRLATILNGTMRALIAIAPATYILKIFLWDKVIGSFVGCSAAYESKYNCETFTTDPLDANLWWIVISVIAFYFAYDIAARLRK